MEDGKKSIALELKQEIARRTAGSSDEVRERVVGSLVEAELAQRTEAIVKGIKLFKELEIEGYKLKEDVISYDENGAIVSKAFSKERIEERKKHNERKDKLDRALNDAFEKQDFKELYKIAK